MHARGFDVNGGVSAGSGPGLLLTQCLVFSHLMLLVIRFPRRPIPSRGVEEAPHEGQPRPAHVLLPYTRVQDGVNAAAEEGHRGGERSHHRPDVVSDKIKGGAISVLASYTL